MRKITILFTFILIAISFQSNAQLIDNDFTGGTLPVGWTNIDNGSTGQIWQFDNPASRSISAPFDTDFAILDSDNYGNGGSQNATLTSDVFDASSGNPIELSFDHQYRVCCGSTASVEVFNGLDWIGVYSLSSTDTGFPGTPDSQVIDISAAAGGYEFSQVRFNYLGSWDYWWAIDNVLIEENNCPAPSNLTVDTNFDGSASFNWNDNPSDSFNYEVQLLGDIQGTDPTLVSSGTSSDWQLPIGTLDIGENYVLYVSSVCGFTIVGPSTLNFQMPAYSNDNCEDAIAISCTDLVSGNTVGANGDPTLDTVGDVNNSPSLWYIHTGANENDPLAQIGDPGNAITLSTCNDGGDTAGNSPYDTKIDIYTGDCAGVLTLVGGNEDGASCANFSSLVSNFNTIVGTDYYIRISGYSDFDSGIFDLSISCESPCVPTATNDDCTSLDTIPNNGSAIGDNTCQTNAINNPTCDPFGTIADLWYDYTSAPGSTGVGITVTFNDGGTNDAVDVSMALYVGCGNIALCYPTGGGANGPLVSGVQQLISLPENFTFQAQVWTSDANTGTFTIEFEDFLAPTCAIDPMPSTGTDPAEFDIDTNALTVSWTAPLTGGTPDFYDIYIGTTSGLLNQIDVLDASVTSYTFLNLAPITQYFWQIRPRIGGAQATGCDEWTFTTANLPVPDCITNPTPGDGTTVSFDSDTDDVIISWDYTEGLEPATGFAVLLGTSSGALSQVGFIGPTDTMFTFTGLDPITEYFWRIVPIGAIYFNDNCTEYTFTTEAFTIPLNDEFTSPELLSVTATCTKTQGTLIGATTSTEGTDPDCASFAGGDVWYAFVAPVSGNINIETSQGDVGDVTDTGMSLYSSTNNGFGTYTLDSQIQCNDDGAVAPFSSISITDGSLVAGERYYVRIWGFDGDYIDNFAVCIYFPESPGLTKTWNGFEWQVGGILSGPPTTLDTAIIQSDYDTLFDGGSIDAYSLIVDFNTELLVVEDTYVNIILDVTVNGTLNVLDKGSVVQTDETAVAINNGTILIEKITTLLNDVDFTILGSPMSGETREGVYGGSAMVRHHITGNFVPNPQVAIDFPLADNFADDNGDNWQTHESDLMVGEGYLVRPFPLGETGGEYTTNYTQGTLNNGTINFIAEFNAPGPDAAANQNASPNILSNPYASSIDASVFITDNDIVDAIFYWEHITAPNISYPGYSPTNYNMGDISIYNLMGGMSAPNEQAGLPVAKPSNQFIPSGQGFGIKAFDDGTGNPIIFDNTMRLTTNNDGYRNSEIAIERLYLSISNNTYGLKGGTLIAFTELATDGFDRNYDAKRLATPISLFSISNDRELGIQGRSAFNEEHVIPLGFSTQVEENQEYTISINSIEGEQLSQATVYLIDNLLTSRTNLSETDYSFSSNEGDQSNRFVLVFESTVLGNQELGLDAVSIYPNPTNKTLNIISPRAAISSVIVFDVQGREVNSINMNNQGLYQIDMSSFASAIYFVKINTDSGSILKKVVKE